MNTCKTCRYKKLRKIQTGPSRRYDYDYQWVCSKDLKKISSYAKVILKGDKWLNACDDYVVDGKINSKGGEK